MAYRLILTDDDWETVAFVGHRYSWSEGLQAALNRCEEERFEAEAATQYNIPEHVAWDIKAAFEADMEGGHSAFPMLDPGCVLYEKLQKFWDEVV